MPYLLILLSLVFVSCGKKENALSQSGYASALEQRTFVTVKHEEGSSLLRKKILNQFVEEKIPTLNPAEKINKGDEIIGNDMDQRDLKSYADNEVKMAKIVVSYTDHEEIFFLPEYVPLNMIEEKLGLKAEADRIFKWSKTDSEKTYSGGTFYLTSVNLDDVVMNDQNFYTETVDLKDQFKNIKLANGKIVELTFSYQTFIQKEMAASFKGRGTHCTRDLQEAGMCGACTYNRNVASPDFMATSNAPVTDLGFSMSVGDKNYNLQNISPEFLGAGQFKVRLDSSAFEMRNALDVVINPISLSSVGKTVAGYNYSDLCIGRSESAGIALQRRVETNVVMKVFGRGFEILKNIL